MNLGGRELQQSRTIPSNRSVVGNQFGVDEAGQDQSTARLVLNSNPSSRPEGLGRCPQTRWCMTVTWVTSELRKFHRRRESAAGGPLRPLFEVDHLLYCIRLQTPDNCRRLDDGRLEISVCLGSRGSKAKVRRLSPPCGICQSRHL